LSEESLKLDPIELVIEDYAAGKLIVLVDDKDRENEGDLCVPADLVEESHLAFMLEHGKGLICAALGSEHVKRLGLGPQVTENRTVFGTNFTPCLDHSSLGERGVSASGRAKTIRELVNPDSEPSDFRSPGWVFPLAAVDGGVFKRSGQTEGSVDLAKLAGRAAGAVICEVMNEEGEMLSGSALRDYCLKHDLKVTSIEALRKYRQENERSLQKIGELDLNQAAELGYWAPRSMFPEELLADKDLKALVFLDPFETTLYLEFTQNV